MIDYEILRIIWWALLGILLIGFAVMDGFDLGVAILHPWVSKNDEQRRVVLNTVGPVWEGNQVWLILGAGAIFAAWPTIYAVAFSGFYLAMLLVLAALIIRPVAFKYRSKIKNPSWRTTWDYLLSGSGFVASLVFGVAMGNVLQGAPFYFDSDLRIFYSGTFWQLLDPFSVLCGLLSVSMMILHGGLFLAIKSPKPIEDRAIKYSRIGALLTIVFFAIGGFWIAKGIGGYIVQSAIDMNGPSNPLHKTVSMEVGAWLNNYHTLPLLWLVPGLGFVSALLAALLAKRVTKLAFIFSSLCIISIITTVGISMFPFILPSSSNPNMSLLVWDASSSKTTLGIMLFATAVFLPIILGYTTWVFRVLRGKVTQQSLSKETNAY